MKVLSIVGARPEFVQVAVLSQAIRRDHVEVLVHSGQHYDERMSERFFAELGIPEPDVNLHVGHGSPSAQTGEMIARMAEVMTAADPDIVIVRGDTNSTLAGAIVAKQLLLPLAHVEGGMRSYDRTMPEELNRIVSDHIADISLVTDDAARARLAAEGVTRDVHVCGDVMYDVYMRASQGARPPAAVAALARRPYDLLTVHRAENVDVRERLAAIVAGFVDAPRPVVFPVHPRTAARLAEFGIALPPQIVRIEPVGYLEMVALESAASTILTDSGGVQREAYFAGVPCVTLRDSTEWTNTVDAGWNRLVGADTRRIRAALRRPSPRPQVRPLLFGSGDAADRIVAALESPATTAIVAAARRTRAERGYAAASTAD